MKNNIIIGLIAGVISFLLILLFMVFNIYEEGELRLLDYRFILRPAHEANENIVIIGIDDNSINTIGRWPWSRNIHSAVLDCFTKLPPKAIAFDILFTEPEEVSDTADKAFAYYSNLLGNVVLAGYLREDNNTLVTPIHEFGDVTDLGLINVRPERDGIIRKIPLVIKHKGDLYPSLVLQVLCTYLDIEFSDIEIIDGKYISVPQIGEIPIDGEGYMWINYIGDQHSFREISYQQIKALSQNEKEMKDVGDSILLIGVTATGIGDTGHIPVATNVPLISVQANALNTILNNDFIYKVPERVNIIAIIALILICIVINLSLRPFYSAWASILLLCFYGVFNYWLFSKNIWLDALGPFLAIAIPFVLVTVYRYGWEEKQRRWVKKVFGHFVSKDVINIMLKDPKKLKLGGESRKATIFYLDLRNFTSYCEKAAPAEVVHMLNECFNWMTEIILRYGGMLDKYMGDAIMAIFGAPVEMDTVVQTESALDAALEIVEKWNKLPVSVRQNMGIGIGINTGLMLVGNMGSSYIFNYTALGDEVNIAARINGLTRDYKVNIIITDSTYNLVKHKYEITFIDTVNLKGRQGQTKIYSVQTRILH